MKQPMQKSTRHIVVKATPYLLLLPGFAFIFAFMFYPMLNTLSLSLQYNVLMDPLNTGFVGLDNYKTLLFDDAVFRKSFVNTLKWVGLNVPLQAVLGMVLALLLNKRFRGRGLVRALAFTPWAVSGVIVALMWSFMYNETMGVFNDIMLRLGIIDQPFSWFSSGSRAMWAMVIATTWRGIPFFAISFLSGLQSISADIYESAQVDGTGKIREFFQITLPIIKDTVVFTLLLRTIWTLNTVDIIYASTGGGPSNSTLTVPVYIMKTFMGELNYGRCAAMAILMAILLIVFATVFLGATKYGKEELY